MAAVGCSCHERKRRQQRPEPDGERAASFLRRTKIMEFSGTTQNTPQGGTSKNKKRTFHNLFCALSHRRFYSVSALCTLSLLRQSFFFSLMFYLFDDSFSLALFASFSYHHGLLLSASTEDRRKYRRACIWSLCFFFNLVFGPSGFCSLFALLPSCSIPSRLRAARCRCS